MEGEQKPVPAENKAVQRKAIKRIRQVDRHYARKAAELGLTEPGDKYHVMEAETKARSEHQAPADASVSELKSGNPQRRRKSTQR